MARIRTVKPELFTHTSLFDLEVETGLPIRLSFIGLFCCCDRAGRFKWDHRELKLHILPYDNLDFSRVLDALWTRGFIERYVSGSREYGCIPSWEKHQFINNRETVSELPSIEDCERFYEREINENDIALTTRAQRDDDMTRGEGKGREGKGKELKKTKIKKERRLFEFGEELIVWGSSLEQRWTEIEMRNHAAYFLDYLPNKTPPYQDEIAAFKNCVRGNWAKLRQAGGFKIQTKFDVVSEHNSKVVQKFLDRRENNLDLYEANIENDRPKKLGRNDS